MRLLIALLFCFFLAFSNAQTIVLSKDGQEKLINKILSSKDSLKGQLKSLDTLLLSGKITHSEQLASIYSYKAGIIWEMNGKQIDNYAKGEKDTNVRKVINKIFNLYQIALDTSPYYAPINMMNKYAFEELLGDEFKDQTEKDYAYLKSMGFKKGSRGQGLGVCYNYNSVFSKSIGLEFSCLTVSQRGYVLKTIDKEMNRKVKLPSYYPPFSYSVLAISMHKDLCRPRYECWVSAFPIDFTFVYLNFTKIGIIGNYGPGVKPLFSYRPEFGIGANGFAVYIAQNIFFKKEYRKNFDDFFLSVKYIRPIKFRSN